MTDNNKKTAAVFGLYPSVERAERAVDELVAAGFSNADVSVLMADTQGSKDFAHEKQTKAPEGPTTGVAAGGTIGGTLGLLAGIGALAIPGVGPFIAAGPIMGALACLGVGGAGGGLVGALVGMGIPVSEAKRYEGRVKDGGVLLWVQCDTADEITRAKDLLKRTGAATIASAGEEAVGATAAPARRWTSSKGTGAGGSRRSLGANNASRRGHNVLAAHSGSDIYHPRGLGAHSSRSSLRVSPQT